MSARWQGPAEASASRFERLAGWAFGQRRRVLASWVAALLVIGGIASAVGSEYHNDNSLPGTESQAVVDTLTSVSPAEAGDTIQIVVADRSGLRGSAVRTRVEAVIRHVRGLSHVAAVQSPYEAGGGISRDATIGYATLTLDGQAGDLPRAAIRRIIDTAQHAAGGGLRVELGGAAVSDAEETGGGGAEFSGMAAALVILVLLFGSVLAASLPLITAVFAVGTTMQLIVLASHAADIADFTPPLMSLVGLGVGIDYALLIFSRYRAQLLEGHDREDAVRVALDTAGRSVLFAALTVVIALLGLYALGLASLQGVALGVALTVLVTMLASVTLLPAMLGALGARLERRIRRHAERRGARHRGRWERWSALVGRRPLPTLVIAVAAVLAIAAPSLGMRLGFADAGNDPASTTSRQAYDLLTRGFGPGFNGPLVIVAKGAPGAGVQAQRTLAATPGIATAMTPSRSGDVSTVIAIPTTKPQAKATNELLHRLRGEVLPGLARQTGATFLVGGATAAASDYADAVTARLPVFLAVVIGLSALLLLVVFRSLLIPLKAAALNLLSIGAALGVVTLVFQHGWLGAEPGPIEPYIPIMIFAIVFGLSMDYEVFLVSRMREEWQRRHDPSHAIARGLATTGSVITAAAGVMIVVFGAFVLSSDRMLQQFGLGLAVAILVDALVIRCLVLPAVMHLLGKWAWWLPRRLDKALSHVSTRHTATREAAEVRS